MNSGKDRVAQVNIDPKYLIDKIIENNDRFSTAHQSIADGLGDIRQGIVAMNDTNVLHAREVNELRKANATQMRVLMFLVFFISMLTLLLVFALLAVAGVDRVIPNWQESVQDFNLLN